MKILHIVTAFPISYPGGVAIYARALANSQFLEGYDVHVLSRPTSDPKLLPGITLHPYSPASVIAFSPKNTFADASANKVRDLVEREAFDIVHFHLSLDLPLDFMKSFYKMGTPYVVSLHDYSYICPRITMIDEKGAVCRSVDLAKCRNCIGTLDQIDLLRRISMRSHVRLPRIPSSAVERRMEIMRIFLNKASALLAVSNRTAEIYREVVTEAIINVKQIDNYSSNGCVFVFVFFVGA